MLQKGVAHKLASKQTCYWYRKKESKEGQVYGTVNKECTQRYVAHHTAIYTLAQYSKVSLPTQIC